MNYLRAIQKDGVKKVWETFYGLRQVKEGVLVGTDELGNSYYENRTGKYPYGQHRWVVHKNWETGQLAEAGTIAPTWFRWLHYTTDDVPNTHFDPKQAKTGDMDVMLERSNDPYGHHYNTDHKAPWRTNPSRLRESGYGVGMYSTTGPKFNGYYTQPGHPLNPLHQAIDPNGVTYEEKLAMAEGVRNLPAKHLEKWQKFHILREEMTKKEISTMKKN